MWPLSWTLYIVYDWICTADNSNNELSSLFIVMQTSWRDLFIWRQASSVCTQTHTHTQATHIEHTSTLNNRDAHTCFTQHSLNLSWWANLSVMLHEEDVDLISLTRAHTHTHTHARASCFNINSFYLIDHRLTEVSFSFCELSSSPLVCPEHTEQYWTVNDGLVELSTSTVCLTMCTVDTLRDSTWQVQVNIWRMCVTFWEEQKHKV